MARDSKQRARLKKLTAAAKAAAIKRNSCARTVLDRTGTGTTDAAFATPTMTENMGQGVFAMDTMSTFSPEEHPGKEGCFIFDNSMNHQKRPVDSLVASQLPLKDGGKNVSLAVRSGWYMRGNELVVQPMQTDSGVAKGLYRILRERGLLPSNGTIRRQCRTQTCKATPPFTCCAVTLLSTQPDFKAQKSMLEEVFEGTPHQLDLLPKFHPEFNPIENVWGSSKAYCRNNCDYTFAGLKETVPKALDSVPLDTIRRFERRCLRFMQAYKNGLPPHLAEFAVKKYASHRHIPPENLMVLMEIEFDLKNSA